MMTWGPLSEPVSWKRVTSSNGTITDMDGNFALSVKPGAVLLISYIGYKPQEVQAVAGKAIKITLKEDTEMLDEVVIVGFGTQKKVNLTGAVGTLSSKELKERPVTSAVAALQGLVPGLNITTPADRSRPSLRSMCVEPQLSVKALQVIPSFSSTVWKVTFTVSIPRILRTYLCSRMPQLLQYTVHALHSV